MRRPTRLIQFGIVVLAMLLGADARGGIITDLGVGYAYDVNSSGQVVGQNDVGHAFLYGNGISTDLGTFGVSAHHCHS